MRCKCLCGKVKFEITGKVFSVFHCHCKDCRKASGSAFSTSGLVRKEDLRLISPKKWVGQYESSKGKFRCFCKNCGSRIFTVLDFRKEYLVIPVALLGQDQKIEPLGHLWTTQKVPWLEIRDSLPQFPENVETRGAFE